MNLLNNYYKGFNNLGNTCYLNSGLQLIINNKELCQNIINDSNTNIQEIKNFIALYYNDNSTILSPNYIKFLVGKCNKEFIGSNQNDSFEFIIYFLNYLFENLKNNNIYENQTKITVKCKLLSCLTKSEHIEKNNFLLLDINLESNNLDDCYRFYKKKEKLMEDNIYFCNKCNDKRIASKRTEIVLWPKHLIIVLKRFSSNNGKSNKISKTIDIPINWRHNYILKGIIFHSGSVFGGHYIYIGYHNNKWIVFNDNTTYDLNLNQLDNYKNNGYIYYYEKNI
jgi:ubiquitin carboxyl-terminal hydrolase 4/11/15